MPHYKLTYFDKMGRAESIRLLFVQAGVDFEDIRLTEEEWVAFKPKTPFGQLPILDVDGKVLAQSNAIATYLAKQFGLNGKDDWEAAKIQELQGGFEGIIFHTRPWRIEQDADKKDDLALLQKELAAKITVEHAAPWLERYEKFLINNGSGYFVGNELTQIDLALMHCLSFFQDTFCPEKFKKFSELEKFIQKISSLPKIAAWIKKRPKTEW